MTYGLDTSVVIRLLMGEPPELVEKVATFVNSALAEGNDFFISDLVVSEAYFVLQKYYGKSKELAVSDLRAIADSPVSPFLQKRWPHWKRPTRGRRAPA